ncbi:amidase [Steroidobacter agaridevorans]|uniref:Amidase n=1 Tax=Steroidobacter agaridevorans TaxID=2695856 RepID=A0A829YKM0_9GAMM|nr:amidase [Steroidobacter agaridevorans]GFE83332.1 amidase [Steroidobacter agaridevorans]
MLSMKGSFWAVVATLAAVAGAAHAADDPDTRTLSELRADLDARKTTSVELVEAFTRRIEAIDRNGPQLRSVIAINPDALKQARALDKELQTKGPRGPLHGIPVLLKDNIESADPMPTTAGSLALVNNLTKRDAPIAANLRAAGAIILGKTNLSEWANFRSRSSTSGWSAVGGLTKNPHVLDRTPCGSSAGSGAAVAAGLAPVAVGTETDGSIICPSAMNGIVGLKPTLGLLSGKHIIPIAHSQDTAGPMTTNVKDAALLLAALVGDAPACDPPSAGCAKSDYTKGLVPTALNGKRIGVLRFEPGRNAYLTPVYERALDHLKEAGATLIEIEMPDLPGVDAAEDMVLHAEFKADLTAYLAGSPAKIPVRSLEQLIEFNKKTPAELALFGQDTFEKANGMPPLTDAKYMTARADGKRLAGVQGIMKMLAENKLDLIVAPSTGVAPRVDSINGTRSPGSFTSLPAVAGYPHLTVPMGELKGLPLGMSFIGAPWSEDVLLSAGYAFEQRAKARITPKFTPTIETEQKAFAPALPSL